MQAHVYHMLDCLAIIQNWHMFDDAMSKTDTPTHTHRHTKDVETPCM